MENRTAPGAIRWRRPPPDDDPWLRDRRTARPGPGTHRAGHRPRSHRADPAGAPGVVRARAVTPGLRRGREASARPPRPAGGRRRRVAPGLSLIHISEPTRQAEISYAVFCLKKK